jgi:hypothetical protein
MQTQTRIYSRGVTSKEVVACLLWGKFACRWEDTKRIVGQHDDITRLSFHHAWDLGVRNILNRVGATRVLRNGNIVIVRGTHCGVVHDVLQDGAEADGVEDLRLLLAREVNAPGVASSLDVDIPVSDHTC